MAKTQQGKKIVPAKLYKRKPSDGKRKTVPVSRHRRSTPN